MGSSKKSRGKPVSSPSNKSLSREDEERPSADLQPTLPIELQQAILNVFSQAFSPAEGSDIKGVIQEVKHHLFSRDFASAFGKQEYLDAYALRWSSSRALCYADIFTSFGDLCNWQNSSHAHTDSQLPSSTKILCIGGGAGGEIVGFAAALQQCELQTCEVIAIDIADWSTSLKKVEAALSTSPQLSQYASESARTINRPLIQEGRLGIHFHQRDILDVGEQELQDMLSGVSICTIMFTLNELFTTSISRTTAFLLTLTEAMQPGSTLLVVDSPGSYSEIKLGSQSTTKQYPMKWLLDHTLLKVAGSEDQCKWKKNIDHDSKWFRISPHVRYLIPLQNMRYQIHAYKRQQDGIRTRSGS